MAHQRCDKTFDKKAWLKKLEKYRCYLAMEIQVLQRPVNAVDGVDGTPWFNNLDNFDDEEDMEVMREYFLELAGEWYTYDLLDIKLKEGGALTPERYWQDEKNGPRPERYCH